MTTRSKPTEQTTSPNVQTAKKKPLDLTDPPLDAETTADLLFQEIGGIELAEILSFGTVSGINQKFNVINNLDALRKEYDPTQLISDYRKGYTGALSQAINLNEKIPDDINFLKFETYDPITSDKKNILLLDLIITLQNIQDDEELEIQIISDGKIYEVS